MFPDSKLRLSDYDVRLGGSGFRGQGTRPASGTLDNDQSHCSKEKGCPWFLARHALRKCDWNDFGVRTALLRITGAVKLTELLRGSTKRRVEEVPPLPQFSIRCSETGTV